MITILLEPVLAQPGPQPTLEDLEKRFQPTFDQLAIQIGNDQLNAPLYVQRAYLYIALASKAYYEGKSGAAYSQKAIADLTTAIDFNPTAELYALRAEVHYRKDSRLGSEAAPKAVVDRCLKGYDEAIADMESAIRLSKDPSELARHYSTLGALYFMRAQPLAKPAVFAELQGRGEKYSLWGDFDQGIEYAKKASEHGQKLGSWWPGEYRQKVADSYFGKAQAANALGELDLALDAYRKGEKYIDGGYFEICNYYSSWADVLMRKKMFHQAIDAFTRGMTASEVSAWNCRYLLSRRAAAFEALGDLQAALADYTTELGKDTYAGNYGEVSIRRARIYLKLGEPEKARDDLTFALGKSFNDQCPQVFRLRAQAERRLGDLGAAQADEEKAAHLPLC